MIGHKNNQIERNKKKSFTKRNKIEFLFFKWIFKFLKNSILEIFFAAQNIDGKKLFGCVCVYKEQREQRKVTKKRRQVKSSAQKKPKKMKRNSVSS